jgi:hypothetical protein
MMFLSSEDEIFERYFPASVYSKFLAPTNAGFFFTRYAIKAGIDELVPE